MTTTHPTPFDAEIKARHRKLWASGDYPAVADLIAPLGRRLVDALHITAGDKLLDVAAGAGNASHSCGSSRLRTTRNGPKS